MNKLIKVSIEKILETLTGSVFSQWTFDDKNSSLAGDKHIHMYDENQGPHQDSVVVLTEPNYLHVTSMKKDLLFDGSMNEYMEKYPGSITSLTA